MTAITQKIERFRELHVPGKPLILFNVWDAGGAAAVARGGAKAIATGSWSVAHANGFEDGEHMPRGLAIDNLRRIISATDLPVTIDLESGYGQTPEMVGETVSLAIEAGAVGCNLEDSSPPDGSMRDTKDQTARIRAARQAADLSGVRFFINARTDVFLNQGSLAEALMRVRAYADAGADGFFVPGLADLGVMARIAEASSLPLNIMIGEGSPTVSELAQNGVARVSYGPGPFLIAMKALEDAAREVHG